MAGEQGLSIMDRQMQGLTGQGSAMGGGSGGGACKGDNLGPTSFAISMLTSGGKLKICNVEQNFGVGDANGIVSGLFQPMWGFSSARNEGVIARNWRNLTNLNPNGGSTTAGIGGNSGGSSDIAININIESAAEIAPPSDFASRAGGSRGNSAVLGG